MTTRSRHKPDTANQTVPKRGDRDAYCASQISNGAQRAYDRAKHGRLERLVTGKAIVSRHPGQLTSSPRTLTNRISHKRAPFPHRLRRTARGVHVRLMLHLRIELRPEQHRKRA